MPTTAGKFRYSLGAGFFHPQLTVLKYEIIKRHKRVLCIYIHKAVDVLHTHSSLFISQTSFILIVACMYVCLVLFFPISCM